MDFLKNVVSGIGDFAGGFFKKKKKKFDEFAEDPLGNVVKGIKTFVADNRRANDVMEQNKIKIAQIPGKAIRNFELPKQIQNPVTDFLKEVVAGVVDSPAKYVEGKRGFTQEIDTSIAQKRAPDVRTLLSNTGKMAELPLNLYAPGGGTVLKGVAQQGFKQLGKQGFKQAVKETAGFGLKTGAGYGAATGVQRAEDMDDPVEYIKTVASDILMGGTAGAVIGGGLGAGTYGVKKIIDDFARHLKTEVPVRFAEDIKNKATKYFDDEIIGPYREAFKISGATEKEIRDAVADFQSGKIGEDVANTILERSTGKYLPQFSGKDTITQSKIWDYILARKKNSPTIEVPPELVDLDQQIFKVVGFDIRQGGYLRTKEFTDLFRSATAKAKSQEEGIQALTLTADDIISKIRVGEKLTPAQAKDLKALRAAMNKQAYDIAGVDPKRGKQEKAFYEIAKEDPDAGDFIAVAESYVDLIDDMLERGSGAKVSANAEIVDQTKTKATKSVSELIEANKVETPNAEQFVDDYSKMNITSKGPDAEKNSIPYWNKQGFTGGGKLNKNNLLEEDMTFSPTKVTAETPVDELLAKEVVPEPKLAPTPPGAPGSADDYIKAQVAKQKAAAGGEKLGFKDKAGEFKDLVARKIEDFTHPIEDALSRGSRQGKYEILPAHDVRYQIDKALRADTLSTQFIKDKGLDKVIQGVDDMDAFNQYLIAKRAIEVATKTGKETGRDLAADQRVVRELGAKYEPFTEQIRKYNDELRNYIADAGLIPRELAEYLAKEYPDYVPFQRVFNAVEEEALKGGTGRGGPASVSTQSVLKRLKGSEREIRNPLESIIENTAIAFRQGERNKAAQMMVSYADLPNNPLNLKRLDPDETSTAKHTISALIDGKKVTYETTEAIADAAKNLNIQQLNVLGKVLSVPTRTLKLGAVGLNLPFVASNLVRDQVFTSVTSRNAAKTSLLNPVNFVKAIYATAGHGKLYDDWVRSGASFTSFDIARDQVAPTVAKIRAGRNLQSKIAYTAKHPGELLRFVEDVIGKSEEVARIQQFGGIRQAMLEKGRTAIDADILAGAASRENAANFGRRGEWGAVLNGAIPFFNAGIQGARSLRRAFVRDPKGTAVRFVATVGTPTVTVTMWNLNDPARKAAYEDIPEYEKENNLIILPPVPTQDENGNWNALKIPVTPGLANLMGMVRRQVEGTQKYDAGGFAQLAGDFIQAGTSIDPGNLLSTFTPQAIKPFIEDYTNTNLFTGNTVVPAYMKDWAPEDQVFEGTSDRAKTIGKFLNVSPLRVENFVSTAFAGVGRQILGKSTIAGEFDRRFFTAKGGDQLSKIYESFDSDDVAGVTSGDINKDVANYAKALKFEEYLGENPYTGIRAKKWEDERVDLALKLYEGDDKYGKVPEETKASIYDELGIDEADLEYTFSADQKDSIKSEYLMEEFEAAGLDHNEIIAALTEGRQESLNGKMMASNGVLDDLYDAGIISSKERTALKKIKLDKEGNEKAGSKSSGSGKSSAQTKLEKAMKALVEEIGQEVIKGPDTKSADELIKDLKASRAPQIEMPAQQANPTLSRSASLANRLASSAPTPGQGGGARPQLQGIASAQELINRSRMAAPQGNGGRLSLRYGGGRA